MKKNIKTIQDDIKDCGACSLSSIIKYYGGYVPLETIKQDTFTTKDGTTLYHLSEAAKKYGFDTVGFKLTFNELINNDIFFPLISSVLIKESILHFIVIYKINKVKKIITIMDPGYGFKTLSFKEFERVYNNYILTLIPQHHIPKFDKSKKLYSCFFSVIKTEKKLILKILLSNIFLIIFSILSGLFIKTSLNTISNYNRKTDLLYIVFIFSFIYIFKVIFQYFRNYYEHFLNKNIDIKIIIPFLNHLFLLPLEYAKSKTTGEIVTRVNELNNIKDLFTKIFVTIILDSVLAISSLVIIYSLNSTLCFMLCFVLVLYILFSLIFNKELYKKIKTNIDYESDFNNSLIENINGIDSIKNLNLSNYFNDRLEKKYIKYLKDTFNFSNYFENINLGKSIIYVIGLFIITSYSLLLIFNNKLSVVDLITFNSLLIYMMDPVKNIVDMFPKINYFKASFNKIREFISLKEEDISYSNLEIKGNIKLNNVSYSYNNYDDSIKNINIDIKHNEHVMLCGNSGSGKSTICKIICRLINGHKGNVSIGGVNILDYDLGDIRKNITYLSQKEELITDTIKNNILLGRNINIDNLNKIIELCHLEEILNKKPLRLNTMIDNNNLLSGGEVQRIILARALLKESNIIILDEALSEVEIDLEQKIIKNILKYFKNKTIIYVTHRNHSNLFQRTIKI